MRIDEFSEETYEAKSKDYNQLVSINTDITKLTNITFRPWIFI